jgi:hypothetical protein
MGFRKFGSINYNVMYHVAKCINAMEELYIVTSVTKPTHVIIKCNKTNACYYKCKLYK